MRERAEPKREMISIPYTVIKSGSTEGDEDHNTFSFLQQTHISLEQTSPYVCLKTL